MLLLVTIGQDFTAQGRVRRPGKGTDRWTGGTITIRDIRGLRDLVARNLAVAITGALASGCTSRFGSSEPSSTFWLFAIIGWIAIAGLTGWLASTKGRSVGAWFVLGMVIGPLALLAVGLAPPVESPDAPAGDYGRWRVVTSTDPTLSQDLEVELREDDGALSLIAPSGRFGPGIEVASWPLGDVQYTLTEDGIQLNVGDIEVSLRAVGQTIETEFYDRLEDASRNHPVTRSADTRWRSQTPATEQSPARLLRELAELRDAGVITPDEFEVKKRELLQRM